MYCHLQGESDHICLLCHVQATFGHFRPLSAIFSHFHPTMLNFSMDMHIFAIRCNFGFPRSFSLILAHFSLISRSFSLISRSSSLILAHPRSSSLFLAFALAHFRVFVWHFFAVWGAFPQFVCHFCSFFSATRNAFLGERGGQGGKAGELGGERRKAGELGGVRRKEGGAEREEGNQGGARRKRQ